MSSEAKYIMGIEEFVRRFKKLIEYNDAKFCFFLGAGCSVSSGIPTATTLVDNVWLPRLKEIETGSKENFNAWLNERFPGYNKSNASQFYGEIIQNVFPSPKERQQEIERLVSGKDPGFGYAVLAQLMAEKCGEHCNIVLTTNFDDMVADALYFYTNKKPIVIVHESLASFVKISDTRPLVIKLHGDSKLSPRNIIEETKEVKDEIRNVMKNLFSEVGLIFIGYGGNDKGISDLFQEIATDESSFQWGIYWIGQKFPENHMGEFLASKNAIWVYHKDFDELMLLIKEEFGLKPPSKQRFEYLFKVYDDTVQRLSTKISSKPNSEDKKTLEKAIEKASQGFKSWLSVELEAIKYKNIDPEKTEKIYQNGINQFLNSYQLLGRYANFLMNVRHNNDKAEEMYKKALDLEPNSADNLASYANFLAKVRHNNDEAEKFYQKALEIEPDNANNLRHYADFLCEVSKDYEKAEYIYRKAMEIDPEDAYYVEIYADFLCRVLKDYNKAEEAYKKAMETEPENAYYIGIYANFLCDILKDYDKAEEIYSIAMETDPDNTNNLESYAIFLKDIRKDYEKTEEMYKKALKTEPDNTDFLGNYAIFLKDVRKDYEKAGEMYRKILDIEPENIYYIEIYANFLKDVSQNNDEAEELYKKALKIEPNNVDFLGNYANFLTDNLKNHNKAEEMYKKALEIDPLNANNLENYAIFLKDIRKDYEKAEEMYKKALEIEPDNADFLGNYAGFLLIRKNEEKYFVMLKKAISIADKQNLLLETWFYCYAHSKNEQNRKQSLSKIKYLIKSGTRSPGWNLKDNVDTAIKNGHPEKKFLIKLSDVISNNINVKELEVFDVWL